MLTGNAPVPIAPLTPTILFKFKKGLMNGTTTVAAAAAVATNITAAAAANGSHPTAAALPQLPHGLSPGDILVVRTHCSNGSLGAACCWGTVPCRRFFPPSNCRSCLHFLTHFLVAFTIFPLQLRLKIESGYPDVVRAVEVSVGAVRGYAEGSPPPLLVSAQQLPTTPCSVQSEPTHASAPR